jgi:hypothetical protein
MWCSTIEISVILALGILAAPLAADAQPLTEVYCRYVLHAPL